MTDASAHQRELRRLQEQTAEIHAQLTTSEREWARKQPFLESRGYLLRSRYRPGWIPSWRKPNFVGRKNRCEDWDASPLAPLIDATRLSDGQLVYVKRVTTGDEESRIVSMFSAPPLSSDPRNHCVPVLDLFQDDEDPTVSYLVMPFLRLMDDPPFQVIDNIVDFVDQILEGLVFIHEHGVAHRDCALNNLMMDARPLFPRGFHPLQLLSLPDLSDRAPMRSRTEAAVKYYYIDFGISVHIPPNVHPKLIVGELGRDQEVPELSSNVPYDPFKVDIFIIGNVLFTEFYDKYSNVGFLRPLILSMTELDPRRRPDAPEALRQWLEVRRRIPSLQRIARLRDRKEVWAQSALLDVFSFVKICVMISRRCWERLKMMLNALRWLVCSN
ncbi:uncharacterized protein PHACADRAFT_131824 [Phanerochaete carnosa HHB-10118-sp]|uniref:Protein kinase domain-containing protein n=1 Tax=Phanerochaete carnosa (strain HHB-10118-sp) TaxID=650164 RepID=K5VDX4_PHACS|nr:uncharacterized protein PHACADRAFT_131824 [Phanerochaete carnosa HHB-10118-sp]EKM49303.1 hypothetical protein PHACADRAFT_131824 [Phanerochaete carnosa HHB-10118-sp]